MRARTIFIIAVLFLLFPGLFVAIGHAVGVTVLQWVSDLLHHAGGAAHA